MIKCEVGDRIAFFQDGLDATGIVVEDCDGQYVVRLDDEYIRAKRGHDCNGRLAKYTGWFVDYLCVTEILYRASENRSYDIPVEDLGSVLNW